MMISAELAAFWQERGAMTSIRQAESDRDRSLIRQLYWEYLEWANARLNQEYGINFDIASMLEQDMNKLDVFLPPDGRLLLAFEDAQGAGIACMRRIRQNVCEIKRMYVRPEFRRRGVGRLLLEVLIAEARRCGYSAIRLDSTRFMGAAHALYRSLGFEEIEPYTESEIPREFHHLWVFMEKQL